MMSSESPEAGAPETTIGDAHEAAVLRAIFPLLPHSAAELLGPGDDAAVIAAPDGRYVVTTDMMVHGPDFRLAWSTPNDLGWKAAATNLADVAAMGAVPTALVVAIAAPKDTAVSALTEIARGLRQACDALAPGCGVVGGDLSVSSTLTIAVTAFGDLGGRSPVLRSGARPGDVLAIAGLTGQAAAALRMLFERGIDSAGEPDAAATAALRAEHGAFLDAQFRPAPPISAGPAAAIAGATAMLDVSDGLALDASRIAAASGVGIDIRSAALGDDPETALRGGEDHALLATFPAGVELPAPFRPIGTVVAGSGVTVDGHSIDGQLGWDPYVVWDGNVG